MAQYMISYLGGDQPASPEEGKAHFAKYKAWLADLGEAAVSPANPLKNTHTVGADGSVNASGTTGMSGFTIVEAGSIDAALDYAKACPFLDIGGSLEVSELMVMPS
ncbi:MAG: YciI family protein [Spongiibacteraceae bacterium]